MKNKFYFKKQFGQNFLKENSEAQKVIKGLNLGEGDTVIEIGPGKGAVTSLLAGKVKRLILVEIDTELIEFLKDKFKEAEIINQDILNVNLKDLNLDSYKVTGSLPYNISKRIISKFLTESPRPEIISFLMQKEVAEDYASQPPKAAYLSNFAKIYSDVEYTGTIGKGKFFPTPKVDGGIVKFALKKTVKNPEKLSKFIKIGYSSPRKKLSSNLSAGLQIEKKEVEETFKKLDLNTNSRPAELTLEEWKKLFESLKNV